MTTRPLAVARGCLEAYVAKDRAAIEALIAKDYHFTSPIDNALECFDFSKVRPVD